MEYIIFYGNLLSSLPNKRPYIDTYVSKVSDCFLEGNLYDVDNHPAFINLSNNKLVKAELYKILDKKVFKIIDDFVGYNKNNLENSYYRREKINLYHSKIIAYVYIFNQNVDEGHLIENGDWLDYYNKKYNHSIYNPRNYENMKLDRVFS